MATLEQLVPPLELCQKIPKDAFNDTALVWKRGMLDDYYSICERQEMDCEFRDYDSGVWPRIPAPTAQEILEAMNGAKAFETGVQMRDGGCFCYRCRISANNEEEFATAGENLPETLLKLWMAFKREGKEEQAQ